MARATSSLPVPASPISTRLSSCAANLVTDAHDSLALADEAVALRRGHRRRGERMQKEYDAVRQLEHDAALHVLGRKHAGLIDRRAVGQGAGAALAPRKLEGALAAEP